MTLLNEGVQKYPDFPKVIFEEQILFFSMRKLTDPVCYDVVMCNEKK
jgi:hypothetical protein